MEERLREQRDALEATRAQLGAEQAAKAQVKAQLRDLEGALEEQQVPTPSSPRLHPPAIKARAYSRPPSSTRLHPPAIKARAYTPRAPEEPMMRCDDVR